MGAGLGVDRLTACPRLRNGVECLLTAEVNDVERRLGAARHLDRLPRCRALGPGGSRQHVVAAANVAARQRLRHEGVDDRGLLAVHLEHAAVPCRAAHRGLEPIVGQPEVVDHEGFEGRHPGRDQLRQLLDRAWLLAADDRVETDVDRRLPGGALAELTHAGER